MKEKSDESLAAANEAELEATVSMGSFFKKEELGGLNRWAVSSMFADPLTGLF